MDCLKSKQNEEQETESEYTSMQQQKKDEEMNNVQIMQKNRRWLGSLAVLDIVFSLFIMFRSDLIESVQDEGEFRFGGSVIDLALWGLGRGAFFLTCIISTMSCCSNVKSKVELFWAMCSAVSTMVFVCYIIAKLLVRLVEDGPWSPTLPWFWTTLLVSLVLISIETPWCISFLRSALNVRLDSREKSRTAISPVQGATSASLSEQLLTNDADDEEGQNEQVLMSPTVARRLKKERELERSLFGNTFAWIYGKLEGVEDEDDDEDEKDDKKKSADSSKNGKKEEGSKQATKQKSSASIVQLFRMAAPDWPILLCAATALIISAIGQSFIPYLTGQIINTVADNPSKKELEESTMKLLIAGLVTAIFAALRGSLFTLSMGKLNIRVRAALLESLFRQEIGFFDTHESGKLQSRLNSDTTTLSDQISLNLNVFLRSLVQAIGVLIFMFRLEVSLSLATFVTVPMVALITKVYGDVVWHLYDESQKRLANANAVSDAALSTMATIRSFAAENMELDRYREKMKLYYTLQIRMAITYAFYAVLFTLLPCLATALVLFYGGKLVIEGNLKAGDLVTFLFYQQSLSDAINSIGSIFSGIAGALGAADKVFELINRESDEESKGHEKPQDIVGKIEFKDVSFRYPARPDSKVLDGINFTVSPGQNIGLVGSSGGGKSSLIKVLLRHYDIESGKITLGGYDINDLDHEFLHEQIAVVGQDPVLYNYSVYENICFGIPESKRPSMEKVIEAAKLANAHDFIMNDLPDKYQTKCGSRGTTLSGGQRQRIKIAAALVRDAKVLLLDEATSALDLQSEALVQDSITKIQSSGKLATIVIAHRLSTIRKCDIFVVDKGKIVESGKHEELIKNKEGAYSKLYKKMLDD